MDDTDVSIFYIIYLIFINLKIFQTLSNFFEHFQTLLIIYFQVQSMMQMSAQPSMIPSSRTRGKTAASSTTGARPMMKKYKCKKCDHEPFTTKYGLAMHINVKHEKKGVKCNICDKTMASHHLEGHMNVHAISFKFTCQEKVKKTGEKCGKKFKQKPGILRHVKQVHAKLYGMAKVKVLEKSKMQFETREDYGLHHEEKGMETEQVNQLVEEYGEEVMVE